MAGLTCGGKDALPADLRALSGRARRAPGPACAPIPDVDVATYQHRGITVTDYCFHAPLDHASKTGETLEIFARAVVSTAKADGDQPYLLYLEGGPGFEAPRPQGELSPAWLKRALEDYRVIFLDQRGMGRSSPIGPRHAETLTPDALAERLTHYRADAIIRDAETLRRLLKVDTWSVLGQSFGGFCVLAYLSAFPGSLREAFITGGLPPLDQSIDAVYAQTFETVIEKTSSHYRRFPEDRERVLRLLDIAAAGRLILPGGDRASPDRVRHLGILLGVSDGSDRLHHLLELPPDSPAFLHDFERAAVFARNPLYAVIHEACYTQNAASAWAAQRARPPALDADPAHLTGEHVFPWMFEEIAGLRPFQGAAEALARHRWGALYDPAILSTNAVPSAAVIYVDDMYVPRAFSEATARRVQGLKPWITNAFEHDGLRAGGGKTLDRLIKMARNQL